VLFRVDVAVPAAQVAAGQHVKKDIRRLLLELNRS
jgi:hypothetical protein